jgi:Flp pilus assembly protein TadD
MARSRRQSGRPKGVAGRKDPGLTLEEASRQFNRGIELHQLGQLGQADSAYRRSIALNPDFPGSHNNLGNVLKDQGKYRAAEKAYRRALQLVPEHPMVLSNIGNVLSLQQKYREAEDFLTRAIRHDPRHFEAYVNLGNVLMALQRRTEAVRNYLKAFELNDSAPELLANLGMVLSRESRNLLASQFLEKAVRLDPQAAAYRLRLGYVLSQLELPDRAERELLEALKLEPEEPRIRFHYAMILMNKGETEKAVDELRRVIALDNTYAEAYRILAQYGRHPADAPTMEALFERKGLSKLEQINLAFGLGEAYESQREYPNAFTWFAKANALSRRLADFHFTSDRDYQRLVDFYSTDPIPAQRDIGYRDPTPIIIAGTSRSGKSLVEKLLSLHDSVAPRGETGLFLQLVDDLQSEPRYSAYPDFIRDLSAEAVKKLGQKYVSGLRTDGPEQAHLTDTHLGNTEYIGLMRRCLPEAKVIICRRGAKDTCISMYKKRYLYGHRYSEDLNDLGKYWSAHERLLDLWHELFPDTVYQLSFETLVRSPEEEARSLLAFCGLACDDDYLAHVRELAHDSHRWPRPEDVIDVWKPYEAYLSPLLAALEEANH